MKKSVLTAVVAATLASAAVSLNAQTHVSTTPEKKAVLLEVFTGIHCGNCPDGDARAEALQNKSFPANECFVISYHTGHYAVPNAGQPDYRNDYAVALDSMGVYAYPYGAVNRHYFPDADHYSTLDSIIGMSRGNWAKSAKYINSETATVNLWINATIDSATRILQVDIEGYFTQTPKQGVAYMLNVALLQNHIIGPQSGAPNPTNYSHENMFRDFFTGQWGEEIVSPAQGSGFTKQYSYIVPDDYLSVAVDLRNLAVVAFVTENHYEVDNVTGMKPVITGFANEKDMAEIHAVETISSRYAYNYFPLAIRNLGNDTVRSLTFEAAINGNTQTAQWEGAILPYSDIFIEVEVEEYDLIAQNNTVSFTLTHVDGTPRNGNTKTFSPFSSPFFVEGSNSMTLEFITDLYGDEITWTVKDRNGNALYENSPYPAGVQTTDKDTFVFPNGGIYAFEVRDWLGDGMSVSPKGSYKLRKGTGDFVFENRNVVGYIDCFFFKADTVTTKPSVAISELREAGSVKVFPNPATDYITVDVPNGTQVELYSAQGRLLLSVKSSRINLRPYPAGVYFIKTDNKLTKIVKQK
ncbi:MAG: Omp28-related outer membrane protein [Bacteroidales bacterium]|nr:Omp28-related outer membrane protein [Bacteroidales bacterium]